MSEDHRQALSDCRNITDSKGSTLEALPAGSTDAASSTCLWLVNIEGRRVLDGETPSLAAQGEFSTKSHHRSSDWHQDPSHAGAIEGAGCTAP